LVLRADRRPAIRAQAGRAALREESKRTHSQDLSRCGSVAVRLADLLAGLSRLAEVGFGLPMDVALRSCAFGDASGSVG